MSNFQRIKYPDGQISAKYTGHGTTDAHLIKERINSYEDLFYIRSIADVIKQNGTQLHNTKTYNLYIPCMFGQRSDRRFDKFQSFDLKLITDIINECEFGKVTILDPHSDVTLALINNSEKESSFQYVHSATVNIVEKEGKQSDLVLVSPDAGAYKKVFEYGKEMNYPVVAAVKYRDPKGNLTLTFMGDVKDKVCLIIDDLCDGGFTFTTLAGDLRKNGAKRVYLYVTHGIFSKGFGELHSSGIGHIYCTNSIKDIDICVDENGTAFTCNTDNRDYITQYKVI